MKKIKIKIWNEIPKDFTGIVEDSHRSKFWYRKGVLHREDGGPAIIYSGGTRAWYQNGKRHRVDAPAIEDAFSGHQLWYQNDVFHRDDGPAFIVPGETRKWYQRGRLHRTDGPAVIWNDGKVDYFINGEKTYKEAVEVYAALFPEKESKVL
jgi:hypothetical protein